MIENCEWCGTIIGENEVNVVESMGDFHRICSDCAELFHKHICRECGVDTGGISIHGLCIGCAQLDYVEKQEEKELASQGLDPHFYDNYESGSEMTDEKYNDWVTFGSGYFSPEHRVENRKRWITAKLIKSKYWNTKTILEHFNEIDSLADREFNSVYYGKLIPILNDIARELKIPKENIHDQQGNVVLVDAKILNKLKVG